MMIDMDVKFNKERGWNIKVDNDEKYDFLSILDDDDEGYEHHKELVTPL